MFLPCPPNNEEKLLYIKQHKAFLYSFGICSTLLLLLGGILFALHQPSYYWYFLYVGMIGIYLGISYFIGIFARPFNIAKHYDIIRDSKHIKPSVDVFIPTAGEEIEIIANTYFYASQLDWPNLKIYCLDDGHREEVRLLAEKYNFNYVARPNKGELKKAGNIRYTFAKSSGDFILILDADFCPRPDFLNETIPYFADPKVAIVQTPQFFRVLSALPWIQRGAASIQELFYRLIQVNRNHWGASICVGTNAVYRRVALAPFGGTYPIQHSEDVHTGFNLLKHGWKIEYVPINLAAGTCPDTIDSFFTQQYRWCMGSTSLFFNKELFWQTKLTLMQRLSFLSGMMYYQATALGLIINALPGTMMVWLSPENVFWYNVVFSLPSLLFGTLHMKLWNKQLYGVFALRTRNVSYYAHLFALKDKLTGSVMSWVPTGDLKAVKKNSKVKSFKRLMLFWSVFPPLMGYLGVALNWHKQAPHHFIPFLLISTFYMFLNLSCFCPAAPFESSQPKP